MEEERLREHKGTGISSCCGAGTYGDNLICESCGEHCSDESEDLVEEGRSMVGSLDELREDTDPISPPSY